MAIKIPQNSKLSSRTKFLKRMLANLQMPLAQKALTLMIEEMCVEKGFKRESGEHVHYYHHLVDVTQKALNFGIRDEKTIVVCILHDAIEDTWITYEYIEREFGKEIADDVLTLTKDKNIDYKKDEAALHAYLIGCFKKLRTAIAKTLDRVHNFGTLGATPLHKQLRVALETEANFFPLFKWAREEYPEYSALFFQAKTEIEPHLEKIKEFAAKQEEANAEKEALLAQIEELKQQLVSSKVDQMHQVVDHSDQREGYRNHLKDNIQTIEVLRKRNIKVENALEFYGKEDNYSDGTITEDKGLTARNALEFDFE